jgi:predicted alpha/beta hydrolase
MLVKNLETDLTVHVTASECLHVKRIYRENAGEAVLMLHGIMANGRIFYSNSGKGLAHYLAQAGFDVFVADLRGRGQSTPAISRHARHGQSESICQDLPALLASVRAIKGDAPIHWVAHSWGGVLMSSCLLRYPELIPQVKSSVYFASKRSVHVRNWHKFWQVDVLWNVTARVIVRLMGYLPARALRFGSDNESAKSHAQCNRWAQVRPWVDEDDGFDYAAAAATLELPPTLYLAAADDPCLGHCDDVRRFRDESGRHRSRLHVLGLASGYLHDYNHASLLTHPDAVIDHFPLVLQWLQGRHEAVSENV